MATLFITNATPALSNPKTEREASMLGTWNHHKILRHSEVPNSETQKMELKLSSQLPKEYNYPIPKQVFLTI